ncbi:integrase, catalytic region, zinc finger, CCHC-type containing protein [Tanacetum coccineum]
MLTKRPNLATHDLHKTALGSSNPWNLKQAKLSRPTLYDGHALLNTTHSPVRVNDSEDALVQAEVSRANMSERPGIIKPINYAELNTLYSHFVPQKELSQEQLDTEYEQCVLEKKNLQIEKKNLLIQNECLITDSIAKDICSIVLASDRDRPLSEELSSNCVKENSKGIEHEAEILNQKRMLAESDKRCSILQKNHIDLQLQGKDDTIKKLQNQINSMSMLNVGPTVGSFDKQALETELTQLKDAITSVRIQNDGFKVMNENVKRRYQELSETNTHSRDALTRKITTLTTENAKLKTELISKISSGPIASEKPKVLAPGMYAISPTYIPPQRRVNRVVPTPLPKKQQVTFQEPPRPSNRPIQKTVVQQNKKPNVPINLSTRVKPATGASKPMSERETRNHIPLPAKTEPIVEPLELTPCVSSSSKVTMISRVTNYTLSDQKAGSNGISRCSRHMTGDRLKLINYVDKLIGTVRFGNDQFAAIVGYGKYKLGNTIISRVYYVEGLSHNLFSVGQFCDGGLEVTFRQHTCHIRNKDMVDLLQGSRSTNLYSISLNEMLAASPVCFLTKTSSTKSWLWHLRQGSPMPILSTRFGWIRFLRTKDETPEVLKKFIVTTQCALNATVRYVRTDNGTEFVNKTLTEFFKSVGITHNTSVPRSPQQNDAKAVATACYILNRSLIHTLHGKTYYELLKGKKPELKYFRVFGSLCYPTNDYDNLGKLKEKADIEQQAYGNLVQYSYCNHRSSRNRRRLKESVERHMLTLQDLKKSRKLSLQSFRTSESMSSSNVKVMKSRRRKITKAFKITTNMSMSDHSSANGKMKKRSHVIQEIRDQDQVSKIGLLLKHKYIK